MNRFARKYGLGLILAWTLVVAVICGVIVHECRQEAISDAVNDAKGYYRLSLQYRAWNASLGGVYADAAKAAPNPYLKVPHRDLLTVDGKQLTLINPAYMTRMVYDKLKAESGEPIISKLISLKPLNPYNGPATDWESETLRLFEDGVTKDRFRQTTIDGAPYLQLVSRFLADKECLTCHGEQGYREGDIRGGLSIAVPLANRLSLTGETIRLVYGGLGLIWMIGTGAIAGTSRRRFQQEETIIEREQSLRAMLDNTPAIIYRYSPRRGGIYYSPGTERYLGYTPEHLLKHPFLWRDSIHPLDRDQVSKALAEADGAFAVEYRISDSRGQWHWFRDTCFSVEQSGQEPVISGIALDITERKETEVELKIQAAALEEEMVLRQRSEEKAKAERDNLRALFDAAPIGMLLLGRNCRVIESNGAAANIAGKSSEELTGLTPGQLLDCAFSEPETRECGNAAECAACALRQLVRGVAAGRRGIHGVEILHVKRKGSGRENIWLKVSAEPLEIGEEPVTILALDDITRQRETEDELLRVRKLESLGVLAGGIAHDFNNLLTSIMGNVSLVMARGTADTVTGKVLGNTIKATERAADLTRQLLTFAKGGMPVKKVISLQEVIEDAVGFAIRGANVTSRLQFAGDLLAVEADAGQMSQVFNNLAINAVQAMPRGGELTIKGENADSSDPEVRIVLTDQGTGIPSENLDRIFDPYFTTKTKGNGLGLASVHSIITRHGGTIRVESSPGQGTSFILTLPATCQRPESGNKATGVCQKGSGTILLMDDDELVREMGEEMLRSLGYEPVSCDRGETAIDLYRQSLDGRSPFAAVILDLTVPGGMGGRETAVHLLALDGNARLIVSSGYSNDTVIAEYANHGFRAAIPKPFAIQQMEETLTAVLNAG